MARRRLPIKVVNESPIKDKDQIILKKVNKISKSAAGISFNTRVGSGMSSGITQSSAQNFYSPHLSTDFLELPQSDREKREWYRHYAKNDPMVGQSLDVLTTIPLSKVRLSKPKCKDKDLANKIMAYYQKMVDDIKLTKRLYELTYLFWLDGNVFIFAEDDDRKGTEYRGWRKLNILETDQVKVSGYSFSDDVDIEYIPCEEDKRAVKDMDTNPLAAKRVERMPSEIVRLILEGQNLPLDTDPNSGSFCYHLARAKTPQATYGSSILERCLLPGTLITIKRDNIIQKVPVENVNTETDLLLTHKGRFRKAIKGSRPVSENITVLYIKGMENPLKLTSDHRVLTIVNGEEKWVGAGKLLPGDRVREACVISKTKTEPSVIFFKRYIKSIYQENYQGLVYSFDVEEDKSLVANSLIVHNCLRVLLFRDKLRQAQSAIASRNMTPKRVVWGDNLDETQLEELREMVELALMGPDFSIVTNYQVNWEEFGSNDRLLDLSNEYDISDRQLMVGLGVTLELLTGEGTFTGNRLSLHVMNERFTQYRMVVQEYVEEYLFKPVAIKMGFFEKDAWGYDLPIYPKLSFNRLALMDNQDTFSALFDLYQKGSLTIDFILDLFNIDYIEVEEKLKAQFGTLSDANFNEAVRNALGDVGNKLATDTDLFQKVCEHLNLIISKTKPEEERF